MKQYAVIGLGYFGLSVASNLKKLGHEVLLLDISESAIQQAIDDKISKDGVCLDATNIHVVEELGLSHFDGVVLSIGENLQDSILTALNLKELGVENIIAKASSPAHGKILEKLNIENVVYPEQEMGERVARMIVRTNIWDGFVLDENHTIIEIAAGKKLISKSLKQLELRAQFSINILAIKRDHKLFIVPSPEQYIQENDHLLVIGENRKLDKFIAWNV